MYSPTEERLRTFIERLSEALTEEVQVIVQPGDAWAAYPKANPPRLTFRLADIAVMLETMPDTILSVTAHEIAHLLYTEVPIKWNFDVTKKPRAAHLLLNAVEDSRIERVFSDDFPGARSLFDRKQEDIYDYKVQRGFPDLPIKWRYILNIDRVLHGLEPWGDARDLEAVDKALDACLAGMWADSTQTAADQMELPYRIMLELMLQEQQENQGIKRPQGDVIYIPPELLEDFGLPSDYETNAPMDDVDELDQRTGVVSNRAMPGAAEDDGKVGGQDSSDGKRAKADGSGSGTKGVGKGSKESPGGAGTDGAGGGSGTEKSVDKKGAGGPAEGRYDELEPEAEPTQDPQGKPTNIIEEMVNEETAAGNRSKTVDILSYRQRHRQREAKEIEKKIRSEQDAFWDELNKIFQQSRASGSFKARMEQNEKIYEADKAALKNQIATLRGYARNVLRDNAMQRFGGNHTSGRKVKTHRLTRLDIDDARLFERREQIGGKSYAIELVVDQSASMRGYGKQELAYKAALVFVEAFDGIVETGVIGFSDIGFSEVGATAVGAAVNRKYARNYINRYARMAITHRTYKGVEDDLRRRRSTIPELRNSYSSTPMEAGVSAAVEQLRTSKKEIRAIVILTDGQPNDPVLAERSFLEAKRLGIETYGLHIGGRTGSYDTGGIRDAGFSFLAKACDHAVQVRGTTDIPSAVYRLLRGVVRSRRAVA